MEAEYQGSARLVTGERDIPVEVHLSGHVEPIDGKYHWGGRIQRDEHVQELSAGRNRSVTLRTDEGYGAEGTLGEQDPWGGCRISGTGSPPFPVPTHPDDVTEGR